MRRQQLVGRTDPPRLQMLVDEVVLRRGMGGRAVIAEQGEHLLRRAVMPNVDLRIVPFAAGAHAAAGVGFTVFDFADAFVTPVDLAEQLSQNAFLVTRGGRSAVGSLAAAERAAPDSLDTDNSRKLRRTDRHAVVAVAVADLVAAVRLFGGRSVAGASVRVSGDENGSVRLLPRCLLPD